MSTRVQLRWQVPSRRVTGTLAAWKAAPTPSASRAAMPCGWISRPAPSGRIEACFSKTVTAWPARARAMALARPAVPAPTIPIVSRLLFGIIVPF
jgi:hypothetical protein